MSEIVKPRCLVLLATYNGDRWLDTQLKTIYNQAGVSVTVIARDDCSSDRTVDILKSYVTSHGLHLLSSDSNRLGSANKNFLKLICSVDPYNYDYIALADQDDVWLPTKLERAILRLNDLSADAYSSDVEAFWESGRSRILKKSYRQKSFDHFFSSPGPGCTFVFKASLFTVVKKWVRLNLNALNNIWVHDWILYAFIRSSGYRWTIDDYVSMRYRQHCANEIGANAGISAVKARLRRVRSGDYRKNILSISSLTGAPSRMIQAIDRLELRDRLWLISHMYHLRRSLKEVFAIAILMLIMRK